MMKISRSNAAALKATHYFTGKPCKYGHVARRFVSTGSCTQCHARQQQTQRERASLALVGMKRVPFLATLPATMGQPEVDALFALFEALAQAATMEHEAAHAR